MADKWRTWKVFEHNGKELFAYTLFGEGEDEEESIHVHKEVRRTKCLE